MKTVLNDEEGISKISTCKKIEKFKIPDKVFVLAICLKPPNNVTQFEIQL